MPDSALERSRRVIALAMSRGFADAGVTPVAPSAWADELRAWLAAGKHGSMSYLAANVAERLNPAKAIAGARSMLVVADQYWARGQDPASDGTGDTQGHGKIARYARGRDYHEVVKRRLHKLCDALRGEYPGELFRAFVDTAPVLEREHAARAGLGWIGKHTLLIHPRRGSYFFLGGIATSLELPALPERRPEPDHCGTCTRCIDACPTRAITPHSVDASRCISYLTIEHRGVINAEFHDAIGGWLYGCDVCQEVCPHNSARAAASDMIDSEAADARANHAPIHAEYAEVRRSLPLLDVLNWKMEDRSRVLSGSAMKRATLAMFRRNAIIVGANTLRGEDRGAFVARLQEIAGDEVEDAMVRETAGQTLDRLSRPRSL
ncbi:MAG: tRNA epoxyqueuosine(34) reductase QueG [Phycisphaerales bacterium]|nr:tRNA epoxyqueuosine(34) reductase QueG [Phycisphaerales bacterium]